MALEIEEELVALIKDLLPFVVSYRESSPPKGCVECGYADQKCDLVRVIEKAQTVLDIYEKVNYNG